MSTTTIRFTTAVDGATFADFRPRRLLTARLNGHDLDPALHIDGRFALQLPAGTNTLVMGGELAYSNDGEGLHRHIDPADGQRYLYAMSFLDAGPRWFASFDQPDLKCRYTMTVRTPPDWTVLGNGRFAEVEPGLWHMAETPPLATYFVTVVAGPYASIHDHHDGIRLGVHARASLAEELATEAADIIQVTKQAFDAYHTLFDERYWVDFGLHRKDWGSIADQGPNSHPVAGNGAADTVAALAQFDGISYAKGAGVS